MQPRTRERLRIHKGKGRALFAFILSAASFFQACQRSGPPASDGRRFPAPNRPVAPIISSSYSDEAARDRNGEAERVIDRLGIKPGLRVADIGAGEGYYTVRLARRLGPSATIYARDVQADYLKQLEARLAREDITGVRLVFGQPRDTKTQT